MILLAVAALLVAEVTAVVAVARQVGLLVTIGLLLAGTLVGGWLLRREGTRAWRAFTVAVAEGRPPGREVLDGMLVLIGGMLVLFPGFVSDVLGLLCLLPLTRRGLAGLVRRFAARRVQVVRVRARRGAAMRYDPAVPPEAGPTPTGPPRLDQPPGGNEPPGTGRVIEGEIESRKGLVTDEPPAHEPPAHEPPAHTSHPQMYEGTVIGG
jgi:UPF0716 protein FxsA